jgi:cytochrome P450
MNSFNGLAVMLAWLLVELAAHRDLLETIRDEVDTADGGSDPANPPPAVQQMMRPTVMECLRLHPVAWAIGRHATAADQLGPHNIAKGAGVVCCTYALHRNPELWTNPETFAPTRFATGHSHRHPRLAFLPFGHGSHACPAARFVPMMLETMLATMLRKYDCHVEGSAQVRQRTLISLMPHPDVGVRLTARAATVAAR